MPVVKSFRIDGYTNVTGCTQLESALSSRPITVKVEASKWAHYKGGVFSDCGTSLNHAVTLIGANNGSWIIKNSWVSKWGEQGYIRLASGNTCGICDMASFPF